MTTHLSTLFFVTSAALSDKTESSFNLFFSLLFCLIAVGNKAKKDRQNNTDNKPLVVAKPNVVLDSRKIETVTESNVESDLARVTLSDANELNITAASG